MNVYIAVTPLQLISCLNLMDDIYFSHNYEGKKIPRILICAGNRVYSAYKKLKELWKDTDEVVLYYDTPDTPVDPKLLSDVDTVFSVHPSGIARQFLSVAKYSYIIDEGTFSYMPFTLEANKKYCPGGCLPILYQPQVYNDWMHTCNTIESILPLLKQIFDYSCNPDSHKSEYLWCDINCESPQIENIIQECRKEAEELGLKFVRRLHPAIKLDEEPDYIEKSSIPLEIEFLLGRPLPSFFATVCSSSAIYYKFMLKNTPNIPTAIYINRISDISSIMPKWFSDVRDWTCLKNFFEKCKIINESIMLR